MAEPTRYRFPGMDPWLEERYLWPSIHDTLIVHLAEEITARLRPRYVARPGRRMVVEIPDHGRVPDVAILERAPAARAGGMATLAAEPAVTVSFEASPEALEVKETFIEIRDMLRDKRIVTVVEVLSPSNKRFGTDSFRKYLEKQAEILASDVNLVEIDLLRAGEPVVAVPPEHLARLPPHDYRIVLRRAGVRDRAEVYPIPLRRRLPRFAIPLVPPDPDAVADLQALLERVYTAGDYGFDIDYAQPPLPPLSTDDATWASEILRA